MLHDVAMALALAAQPDRREAEAALKSLIEQHGDDAPFRIALVYAYRRATEQVFEWLDRAYALRDPRLIRLLTTPFLKPYYSEPRFLAICQKLTLPVPN